MPNAINRESIVSRETFDRLQRFVEFLHRWSGALNLTGRRDTPSIWTRHIEDSLQLAEFVPADAGSFVDVGSGAGFPAIPLAIASGLFVHLVESDRRKAAFLQAALAELQLPGTVWNMRVEVADLPHQRLCTARAVAPLSLLVRICKPLLTPTATCLFPKGRTYRDELAAMPHDPSFAFEAHQSKTDSGAAIIVAHYQQQEPSNFG